MTRARLGQMTQFKLRLSHRVTPVLTGQEGSQYAERISVILGISSYKGCEVAGL